MTQSKADIIGPISREEWLTLGQIKQLMDVQKNSPDPDGLIKQGLEKEKAIFDGILASKRSS